MRVTPTSLPEVLIVEPRVFDDERGFFVETWHQARYADAGLPSRFVQDNHSRSRAGVLRGLHYQHPRAQGKLVRCVRGAVFDVAVDIRRESPTFGRWVGVELSENNKRQLWVPPGFAHGFCVPEVESDVEYKCTEPYYAEDDRGVLWADPAIGIAWPLRDPVVSAKDARWPVLAELDDHLPRYDRDAPNAVG